MSTHQPSLQLSVDFQDEWNFRTPQHHHEPVVAIQPFTANQISHSATRPTECNGDEIVIDEIICVAGLAGSKNNNDDNNTMNNNSSYNDSTTQSIPIKTISIANIHQQSADDDLYDYGEPDSIADSEYHNIKKLYRKEMYNASPFNMRDHNHHQQQQQQQPDLSANNSGVHKDPEEVQIIPTTQFAVDESYFVLQRLESAVQSLSLTENP